MRYRLLELTHGHLPSLWPLLPRPIRRWWWTEWLRRFDAETDREVPHG